jgi:hypothetical protein
MFLDYTAFTARTEKHDWSDTPQQTFSGESIFKYRKVILHNQLRMLGLTHYSEVCIQQCSMGRANLTGAASDSSAWVHAYKENDNTKDKVLEEIFLSCNVSRSAVEATRSPTQWVPGEFPRG